MRAIGGSKALATVVAALLVAECGGSGQGTGVSPPQSTSEQSPTTTQDEGAGILRTVAGGGKGLGDGGPATSAGFCGTTDVAVDAGGSLYIADSGLSCAGPGGNTVRKVDPNGIITTVAGTGELGFSGDGGAATAAQLRNPIAVAVDAQGNLYISDLGNHRIRKVDPEGMITTFGGTGKPGFSGDGGPAAEAQLSATDVAVNRKGDLYFSDTLNQRVRRVDRNGFITTVAGTGERSFSPGDELDGRPAVTTALWDPVGIAVDLEGNLFIGDHHANRVRVVDRQGIMTTVAGTGKQLPFSGEEGLATETNINQPWGLFVDDSGVLYIADAFNARVRAVRFGESR
jgi:sugar lactone lactonase YvrE